MLFLGACGLAVLVVVRLRGAHVAALEPRVSLEPRRLTHVDFISAVPDGPLILFRDASPGATYGKLAVVQLSRPDAPRQIAPLSCERVHYAAGWGVCMVNDETRLLVRHARVRVRSLVPGPPHDRADRVADPGARGARRTARRADRVRARALLRRRRILDENHRDRHDERPPARGSRGFCRARRTARRSSRSISISGASPSPPTAISSSPR